MLETDAIRERPGMRMVALALQTGSARQLGRAAAARRGAEALLAMDTSTVLPFDADPVRLWRAVHDALEGSRPAQARAAATRADAWLREVERHGVPAGAEAAYARLHAADCAAMGIAAPFARPVSS